MSITTPPGATGLSPGGRVDAAPARPRTPERLPQPARRRRPGLAALAVMLVVGSSAVSASLVLNSGETTSVLTVVRPVPAGQVLSQADLGTADVSGTGLTAVAASSRDDVVGLTATVGLLPGTLLSNAMVTRDPVPGPGEAVVGLSLKPGLLPESELRPGTTVMLVRLPSPSAPATTAAEPPGDPVLVPRARVLSEATDPTTGGRLVSLLLDQSVAAEVSRAAAAATVSVVVIGPGT